MISSPADGAFFLPLDGGRFAATELTRGPWSADAQHAGPPAALLGRAVEHHVSERPGGGPEFRVTRMTFEILRPVPLGELSVSTRSAELGRSVERVDATLMDSRERVVMRASALRVRTAPESVPDVTGGALAVPGPEECSNSPFYTVAWDTGYHTAMDFRFVSGAFLERGPAMAWFRMRVPLVAGEEPSGLCRVLAAADSGNGISSELDIQKYLFVNTDLNVHLVRPPVGEWVGLDSRTTVNADGIGLADSLLLDEHAAIGRASQSLFIAERA